MKETFGQRLQRLRQTADISQPKLAAVADIPIGTLRNLEQDRRIPRLDTASALAYALGIGLDELTGEAFRHEPAPKRTAGKSKKRK